MIENLAFMGDTAYWQLLDLATAGHPAITLKKKREKPSQWQVNLSEMGGC